MPVSILEGEDCRRALQRGVDTIANVVGSTLGPGGKNIILQRKGERSSITKDGVSVAEYITLADPHEDLGAEVVRRACHATVHKASDGTTTTAILVQAFVREWGRMLALGESHRSVRAHILEDAKLMVETLRARAQPVLDRPDLVLAVARTAANRTANIPELAAEATTRAGVRGTVVVRADEHGPVSKSRVIHEQGYVYGRGVGADAVNGAGGLRVSNARVLVTLVPFTSNKDLTSIATAAQLQEGETLVIAGAVSGAALGMCTANGIVVLHPGEQHMLEDLAVYTGATVVRGGVHALSSITREFLGTATEIEATTMRALFVRPGSLEQLAAIGKHTAVLAQDDSSRNRERIAKLNLEEVTIMLCGPTAQAYSEAKDLLDDAIGACRAALRDGVLPGAGSALLRCASKMGHAQNVRVCEEPTRRILLNAGVVPDVVIARLATAQYGEAYDVVTGKIVDLLDAGIVDAVAVTCAAVEHAAVAAAQILSTASTVVETT